MHIFPYFHINVFTNQPDRGNSASVIQGSAMLSDEQRQSVAGEMGLPGNGFLWPTQEGESAFHARFHTPQQEVSLSGHTALACAHAIFSTSPPEALRHPITLRTASAQLTVKSEDSLLWLTIPLPHLRPYSSDLSSVATGLNLSAQDFRSNVPVQLSPENDLLVPLSDRFDMARLTPNVAALSRLGKSEGIRGFCCFNLQTHETTSHVHSRFFAPHFGVPEDPATGSVHGPLALVLWQHGLVSAEGEILSLVGEQGDSMGRPSRLHVRMQLRENQPHQVEVGGETVTVRQGTLNIPR